MPVRIERATRFRVAFGAAAARPVPVPSAIGFTKAGNLLQPLSSLAPDVATAKFAVGTPAARTNLFATALS